MKVRILLTLLAAAAIASPLAAAGQITAPPGYIYDAELLGSVTQNCVASGPGGTFVGIGKGFTANAGAIVLAKESGELRLVASGFNSIGDCAYDAANDVLYVTDNADNADLDITTGFAGNTGAQTGDTIFAVPSASSASGLAAPDLEMLPAGSLEFAANLAIDSAGDVFVGSANGGGAGFVAKLDLPGPVQSTFIPALQFTGGLAFQAASGDLFVAEGVPGFMNQLSRFDSTGTPVAPTPLAGPGFGFGSVDLAFNADGKLLASGLFAGDVVAIDVSTGTPTPFVSGLTFASGLTLNPFTDRVEILSSTFSGADEDRSIHRFTPIGKLTPGKGSAATECLQEFYGLELTGTSGKEAACTDGSACDSDGTVNDVCLFPVGFCFNVEDPDFTDCDAGSDLTSVEISSKPLSLAVKATADRLAAALPLSGSACFFSDGYAVPVKIAGSGDKLAGKATLKVKSEADDGRKDSDVVKLVCAPAP
jgi:hypothetical protein